MFAYFGSDGVRFYQFDTEQKPKALQCIKRLSVSSVRNVVTSKSGKVVVSAAQESVCLSRVEKLDEEVYLPIQDSTRVVVSPCGNFLFVYKKYQSVIGKAQGDPNVHIYDANKQLVLKRYTFRNTEGWQPRWSADSVLCASPVSSGELAIYVNNRFADKPAMRLNLRGMRHFSVSNATDNPNIAVYIHGQQSQPSVVRIYQWQDGKCPEVASTSFYRADTVRFKWNDRGTDLLILASIKESKTNYYGDQNLYQLSSIPSRNSSSVVPMPRQGPIYDFAWRPSVSTPDGRKGTDMFAVCHGAVPASVTVFGTDGRPRFDFGTGTWNQIHFNPQGNLLLLAGLGNLPGYMSVWDFDRQEPLARFNVSDTTNVGWLQDGEHLLFFTATPRLRVNNGFGIWHYGGEKLTYEPVEPRSLPKSGSEHMPPAFEHELYAVYQLPLNDQLPPAPTPKKFSSASKSDKSSAKTSSVYVPPSLRHCSDVTRNFEFTKFENQAPRKYDSSGTFLVEEQSSKNAARRRRKQNTKPSAAVSGDVEQTGAVPDVSSDCHPSAQSDPVTTKRISAIRKKLKEIEKLKFEQTAGKQLAFNQVDKIKSESQLLEELSQLTLIPSPS